MKRRALALLALVACAGERELRLVATPPDATSPNGRLELLGLAPGHLARGEETLAVRVASAPAGFPAMVGTTRRVEDRLVFEPRFPLEPGRAYRATLDDPQWSATVALPESEHPREASVTHVFPSGAELPSNVLKFYLHFSHPMRRGEAYEHVHIVDADGEPVPGAFLEVYPELWDPEATRLTLFIDPGRIKRELVLHEQMGPVFHEYRDYALVVDASWRDARGVPLREGLRKPFRTVGIDTHCPDPERWSLSAPEPATREPLAVRFREPLDHALALRVIDVVDADGNSIAGTPRLDDGERLWSFTPAREWSAGTYRLVVPTLLEDRAGNGVGRPFEVMRTERGPIATDETVRVSFRIEN